MNILITSIGQRGYLIDHFKESANGKYYVYAADATRYAPALQNADKAFVLPMANDSMYCQELLGICKENDIKGVISINDIELPTLAKLSPKLADSGIMAIVSDPEVIDICFDKYKTYEFCKKNEIPVPRSYLWNDDEILLSDISEGLINFPLIAKPRKGSRSVGIHLLHNMKELLSDIELMTTNGIPEDEKFFFQEYLDSEQYSIHIFNNVDLEPISIVSMVNLFKNFGETFHIKTFREDKLTKLGIKIGKKLKHFGPLSADVHQRGNGEYVVLEFNPRISGCYSLSHYAGADYPSKIYKILKNEKIFFDCIDGFDDDVIMLKQFTTFKISESIISQKLK